MELNPIEPPKNELGYMVFSPKEACHKLSKLVQPILLIFDITHPGGQAEPHRHSQNFQNTLDFHISGKYDPPFKKNRISNPKSFKKETTRTVSVSHRSSTKLKKNTT